MKRLTTEQFIQNAIAIHGNKYDYTHVVYKNNSTKVKIVCKIHGPFLQKPNAHVDLKQECPICGEKKGRLSKRLTTDQFIERAKQIHGDRYDYTSVRYTTNTDKVKILCKLHGYFEQEAYTHINRSRSGCSLCGKLGISNKALEWIEDLIAKHDINIQHALNGGEYKIPGTRFKADGYCKDTNTIYEFYGDKWHGNPAIYTSDERCHPFSTKTAGQLLLQTVERERKLIELGYTVVSIWEQEYDKYKDGK